MESEGVADELARLRAENRRLLEANAELEKANEKLLARLGSAAAGGEGKDQLWPIRQHLMNEIRSQELAKLAPEPPVTEPPVVLSPRSSQRDKIVAEILETERRYVHDLVLLQHLFRNPFFSTLHDGENVLTREEFETVFSNSETLLHLNSQFLEELSVCDSRAVGGVFLQYAPMFKLYSAFCAGLSRAFETIKVLRARPASAAILALVEKLPDLRRLQLESFLSLPMQRVLRYVLLLETLDKNTDDDHPDKAAVHAALAKLRLIAAGVNESVTVLDRAHRLVELKRALSDCPFEVVTPARRFVREGFIKKITSKFVIEDWYVLLSDVLLYCSRRSQHSLVYKGHVALGTAWVRDLPDTEHVRHILQLVAPQKTFTLYFDSADSKAEWRRDMEGCIARLVESDPSLEKQRGRVRPRLPESGFYAVLRNVFGYTPDQFEREKEPAVDLDEFVLVGSQDGSDSSVVRLSELASEERPFADEAEYNDFAYWKVT